MKYFLRYYFFVLKNLVKNPRFGFLIFITLLSLYEGEYLLALTFGVAAPLIFPVFLYLRNEPMSKETK